MKKQIYLGTIIFLALLIICATITVLSDNELCYTLAITFGTFFHHFFMRLSVGGVINVVKHNQFDYSKAWFQKRAWEDYFYKRIRIKSWKTHMPTFAPELFDIKRHSMEELVMATCQAEVVHEVIVVFQETYLDVWLHSKVRRGNNVGTIELIEVNSKYANDIWEFRKEILEHDMRNEDQFAGCLGLSESDSAEEWIDLCNLRKNETTCDEAGTLVPSHTYMAVRKQDDKIVGIIDLRHHINHLILGTWGGHCGYSVRPVERGKGYAKEMLRLNLIKAKQLGIERFLVTCNTKNVASQKTILANGGIYESTLDVEDEKIERYWINL